MTASAPSNLIMVLVRRPDFLRIRPVLVDIAVFS